MMDNEQVADRIFRGVEARIEKALGPLFERLEALESIEIPGAADVAKAILGGEEIRTLVDLHVAAYWESNPPAKGKDADPVSEEQISKSVAAYLRDHPVKDGRDGLDVKDMFRDHDGHLIAVMSNGDTKDLGRYMGKDGVGITDLVRSYDDQTHEIVERWGEKELRYPAGGIRPGGYWREGTKAVAAQVWNHAGVAWIAKRDTTAKPMRESADWEIFANKGRDGKDGVDGKAPPGPVSLRSAANA